MFFTCLIIAIVIVHLLLYMKKTNIKHYSNQSQTDSESDYYDGNYRAAEFRLLDEKYKSKILPEALMKAEIAIPFYLSLEQDYDCFFLMTENDGKTILQMT